MPPAHAGGRLTIIALPHPGANCDKILGTCKPRFGLHIVKLNPTAGAEVELGTARAHYH